MATIESLKKELAKATKMKELYLKNSKGNKNNDYVRGFAQEEFKINRRIKAMEAKSKKSSKPSEDTSKKSKQGL